MNAPESRQLLRALQVRAEAPITPKAAPLTGDL